MKQAYCRDASNRLCFELGDKDSAEYWDLRRKVRREFGLLQISRTTESPDAIFATFVQIRTFRRIGIEWDNWSGFTIVAKNERSASLVQEVGTFLQSMPEPSDR